MLPAHDNYYDTAATCFGRALSGLGPGAERQNQPMFFLLSGLAQLAQGLLQQESETGSKLDEILRRLTPSK